MDSRLAWSTKRVPETAKARYRETLSRREGEGERERKREKERDREGEGKKT